MVSKRKIRTSTAQRNKLVSLVKKRKKALMAGISPKEDKLERKSSTCFKARHETPFAQEN